MNDSKDYSNNDSKKWMPEFSRHSRLFVGALALGLSALTGLSASTAEAYPLNPWGSLLPSDKVTINPFVYVYPGPFLYPYMYAGKGLTEKLDVWAGVGATIGLEGSGASRASIEVFPRYFVTEELGLSLHLTFVPGVGLTTAPEAHFVKTWDKFSLTVNASYKPQILFSGGGFDVGSVYAIIAPEWYFSEQFSAFLEVNAGTSLTGGGMATQLVPGIWFALDPDQKHSFAIAAQVPILRVGEYGADFDYSAGIWYSTAFGGE